MSNATKTNEAQAHIESLTEGTRVDGPFGAGTVSEPHGAFGETYFWVDFDAFPGDSKLCNPNGLKIRP